MKITSKQNEIIKLVASLKDKKNREAQNLAVLEGIKIIKQALKNGVNFKYIFYVSNDSVFNQIKCEKFEVTQDIIAHISSTVTPQSVVAVICTQSLEFALPTSNFILLDNIQNPDNAGAIFRSAVAFNYNQIYLYNCTDEYNTKTIRASMGNQFAARIYKVGIEQLKLLQKFNLIIADMNGTDIKSAKISEKIFGLVIGNEGNGISTEIQALASKIVSIKMHNNVESLNASVSAGILMYELQNSQQK